MKSQIPYKIALKKKNSASIWNSAKNNVIC